MFNDKEEEAIANVIVGITVIVVILLGRYAIKKGQELENKKR